MNDVETFCEYCGHNSTNPDRCTHCGHVLDTPSGLDTPFRIPTWGRLRVELKDPADTGRAWQALEEIWQTKVLDWFRLLEISQMDKRDIGPGILECTAPDLMIKWVQEVLPEVTVSYQEMPREQYPHGKIYKPLRAPTVPRGKRKP